MKKLITLTILATLLLSGCGSSQHQPQPVQQPRQVQQSEDEMSWFADEVLDMDDWGEKKKYTVKTEVTKPSTKPSVSTKPTAKPKASAHKKNP